VSLFKTSWFAFAVKTAHVGFAGNSDNRTEAGQLVPCLLKEE
jgi:hypothetical protein